MMKNIKTIFRNLLDDIIFIFLNYGVGYIPFWTIRKLFYRMFGMKIGKRSRIAMRCVIQGCNRIVIGNNSVINEFVYLDGRGRLTIGDNNSISMYAKIYSATHKSFSNQFEYWERETIIEDNCWIGTSAVVMPGSHLKDFTIISVNSVFKGTSEIKGIYMGIPAVLTKSRKIDDKYEIDYSSFFR